MKYFTVKGIFLLLALCLLLIGCQAGDQLDTAVPDCGETEGRLVRERLEETERGYPYDFQVYLPPCYDQESSRTYPILFVIPGLGGSPRSWLSAGIQDIADEMILAGEVPPFLIVSTGTISTTDQNGDLIANEVVPFVQDAYRVHPERQFHSVAGGSLGGIAAYRIVYHKPDYFANMGIFGSGVITGEEDALRGWIDGTDTELQPRVFLNTGEEDPLMMERAIETIAILDEAGVENTAVFSSGGHDYGYWASNFAEYYRWMAQDWQ